MSLSLSRRALVGGLAGAGVARPSLAEILTQPPRLRRGVFKPSRCPEALALFARAGHRHGPAAQRWINYGIAQSVAQDLWSDVVILCIPGAASAGDLGTALLNLKAASPQPLLVNGGSLTPFGGLNLPVGSWIDLTVLPTDAPLTQNSVSFRGWTPDAGQIAAAMFGQVGATRKFELYNRYTDDKVYSEANNTPEDSTANTDGSGEWSVDRTVAGSYTVGHNGATFATYSVNSSTPTAARLKVGQAHDASGYWTNRLSGFAVLVGQTTAKRTAFHNIWAPVMAALGGVPS